MPKQPELRLQNEAFKAEHEKTYGAELKAVARAEAVLRRGHISWYRAEYRRRAAAAQRRERAPDVRRRREQREEQAEHRELQRDQQRVPGRLPLGERERDARGHSGVR